MYKKKNEYLAYYGLNINLGCGQWESFKIHVNERLKIQLLVSYSNSINKKKGQDQINQNTGS